MIDGLKTGNGPLFLASVTSAEEARLAASGGASIIDCKDPSKGALGALEVSVITSIVNAMSGRLPVSATVGDLPSDAGVMVKAATRIAAAGVDIVKVGFFESAGAGAAIAALGKANLGRAKLFAVLMADRTAGVGLDFTIIPALARAGFIGVMLDTADKSAGALPGILDDATLSQFLGAARAHGLSAGLAGSLRVQHIAGLVALSPDIIGFRGALTDGGRTGALNAAQIASVRDAIDAATAQIASGQQARVKRSVA